MPLNIPVIRTKIIIPRRRTEILSRPRLLSVLESIIDLKLLILAAPAGYGKTSLLVDFAHHSQLPICWYALDALDNEPQRFIAHFILSIKNRFKDFGESSFAALGNVNSDPPNLDPVISAIVNDAYENISEHFVLVLDDYHLVRDSKPIDEFINRITQEMSENCHFIIASRTLLTLPDLTLLVARSQVGGLSFEELAFLPEEIKQLMFVNYNQTITDSIAADLVRETEGWITGVLLTAQLSPKGEDDRLRLARVSGIGIYEYLAQQVLDRQSQEMQSFLLRTSLLEEFDANLCEEILGDALKLKKINWQEKIDNILRDNLFILPVDDETLHLRYHHLFRDFLQNRMRLERPDETLLIEKKLGKYYWNSNEWERAHAIYSRIGDPEDLAALILAAAPTLILACRLTNLTTWLEELPSEFIDKRPELLSIVGATHILRGENQESLVVLTQAINGLLLSGDKRDLVIALIRRANANRYLGHYQNGMEDIDQAIGLCKKADELNIQFTEALRIKGIILFQCGDPRESLKFLNQALGMYKKLFEPKDTAKVLLDLGIVYSALGQFNETEVCYKESLEFWQTTQNASWQANILNNLGVIQHMRGQYEHASLTLEKAVLYSQLASNARLEGFSLTSLGDLYRDIDAYQESRLAYDKAQVLSEKIKDQSLGVFLDLSAGVLERIKENYIEANNYFEQGLEKAQLGGSKYEINLVLLELCSLGIKKHDLDRVLNLLFDVSDYFLKEGYSLENKKARFLMAISRLSDPEISNLDTDFISVIDSIKNEVEKNSLLQMGREFEEILQNKIENDKNYSGAGIFLFDIREFKKQLAPLRRLIRRQSNIIQFSAPRVIVKAFGKSQVKIGDHVITVSEWKTQAVRDLFFFILLHNEGVTKEEIGEAFWPESTVENLKLRFKNTIYRLRRALGTESINFMDEYYRFNRSLDYDYDVETFLQEIKSAQSIKEHEQQIKHYQTAINCYHGPYLPKLDYDWVLSRREQFHQIFLTAITHLINLLIQNEQYQLAIQYADRAIEEDPCQESAHRSAMLAYSSLGDRAGVVRQFEKCKKILKKELNIEPAIQTKNLYNTLMR